MGLNTQVEECSVGWESIEKECMVMLIAAVRSVKWSSSSVKQYHCIMGISGRGGGGAVGGEGEGQWDQKQRGSERGRGGAVGGEVEVQL